MRFPALLFVSHVYIGCVFGLCVFACRGESNKGHTAAEAKTTVTASPIDGGAHSLASNGASFESLLAKSPLSSAEIKIAKDAVGNPAHGSTNDPTKARVQDVQAALGDKAIPALAHQLTDYNLGSTAVYMMLQIDRDRAAPYVFASIPQSDRNVQHTAFRLYRLWIESGEKPCCLDQMHAAAIRSLQSDQPADVAEVALYAIGLTGDEGDISLLRQQYQGGHSIPLWERKIQLAAEAAMARFGDETSISHIEAVLREPVGKAISSEEANSLSEVIGQAGFSKQMRFMPLLCKHLEDPSPTDFTDSIPMAPNRSSSLALSELHGELPTQDPFEGIKSWRTRCAAK